MSESYLDAARDRFRSGVILALRNYAEETNRKIRALEWDTQAYRKALGYSVSPAHTGKLTETNQPPENVLAKKLCQEIEQLKILLDEGPQVVSAPENVYNPSRAVVLYWLGWMAGQLDFQRDASSETLLNLAETAITSAVDAALSQVRLLAMEGKDAQPIQTQKAENLEAEQRFPIF